MDERLVNFKELKALALTVETSVAGTSKKPIATESILKEGGNETSNVALNLGEEGAVPSNVEMNLGEEGAVPSNVEMNLGEEGTVPSDGGQNVGEVLPDFTAPQQPPDQQLGLESPDVGNE
ncbi:uncharacterized protein [Littorina saxatilis]|uniref:uncharacterized protein n=1 Tax=Littorina saxatilis TaxID=31220 RepID=UPI0038B4C547